MRGARRALALVVAALAAAGCAAPARLSIAPAEPPLVLSDADSEAELGRRLVGRGESEVDVTTSERTLVIGAMRRQLYEYVGREVTRQSRAAGGNQHPVLKEARESVLPIVQVKP